MLAAANNENTGSFATIRTHQTREGCHVKTKVAGSVTFIELEVRPDSIFFANDELARARARK